MTADSIHAALTFLQLLVDDLLVFSGSLPPIARHAQGILPTLRPPMKPYIINLGEPNTITGCGQAVTEGAELCGEIQFTNNHHVVAPPSRPKQQNVANQGNVHMYQTIIYTVYQESMSRAWASVQYHSLVPRPLPVHQCCTLTNVFQCTTLKSWVWPGDEATNIICLYIYTKLMCLVCVYLSLYSAIIMRRCR